jgi:hypothetical protein
MIAVVFAALHPRDAALPPVYRITKDSDVVDLQKGVMIAGRIDGLKGLGKGLWWWMSFDEGLGGGKYRVDTLILFSQVAPENLRNYPFCDSGLSRHVHACK